MEQKVATEQSVQMVNIGMARLAIQPTLLISRLRVVLQEAPQEFLTVINGLQQSLLVVQIQTKHIHIH